MQAAVSKRQPTPSASAGTPLRAPSLLPLPPWAARVRTQVQGFHVHAVHDLFVFMDGETGSHLSDPTRPTFYPSAHHSFGRDVLGPRLCLAPCHAMGMTQQPTVPVGLACRWRTLPHPSTITRPQCGRQGWGCFSSAPSEKGPPPESLPGRTEPPLPGSPAGVPGTSDCSKTRARGHLFAGKVLFPKNTQTIGSFIWSLPHPPPGAKI